MFSGIVSGLYPIKSIAPTASGALLRVFVHDTLLVGLKAGDSIAVNGVCLTVIDFTPGTEITETDIAGIDMTGTEQKQALTAYVSFDVVPETLRRSNLSELGEGSFVNIERSLRFGDEVGGHLCSGHIDCILTVVSIIRLGEGAEVRFSIEKPFLRYIFEKGYVALNGASLTVAKKYDDGFSVAFIPETLKKTNLGLLDTGTRVNLEIDRSTQVIVETVERVLSERQ